MIISDKNYKISSKDILHLTEKPPDHKLHLCSSIFPLIGTQEIPVSNLEENLRDILPFVGKQPL